MFVFAERAVSARQWVHVGVLSVLGLLAAGISGSVVLQRNAYTQAERVRTAQSANLPKAEAQKALAEAKEALAKAEAAASAECSSGRGTRCASLEQREQAARQRVAEARAKLAGLGAHTAENPVAAVMGGWAATFQQGMAVAPALWLEMAAPALLAFGFAPWPRKEPEPKKKVRGRRKQRAPRKPAKQNGVTDWVEAYRAKHGRAPKVADVRQAFGVSKTTAWRRLRSAS
jgi:hypothetical protein